MTRVALYRRHRFYIAVDAAIGHANPNVPARIPSKGAGHAPYVREDATNSGIFELVDTYGYLKAMHP